MDQFYGIEMEEFPAQIAQTALWLMDHQMNLQVSEEFGHYFVRLPLTTSATIVHGQRPATGLAGDRPPRELNYILGNPPFGGAKYIDDEQHADMAAVLDVSSAGAAGFCHRLVSEGRGLYGG